jgi:septum formation protein
MSVLPVRVILASQSPRRRELLTLVGIPHEVRPADIDEALLPGEDPLAHVLRLAREKARTVAAQALDAVVIGADTVVVVDREVLGKPRDAHDAATMLRKLRGRAHVVHSAVAVVYRGDEHCDVESVDVTFGDLDDQRIAAYVATGEPLDKAGAYGIQGYGASIVTRVAGDYFAVMGLPIARLVRLLERSGLSYRFGALTAAEPERTSAPSLER